MAICTVSYLILRELRRKNALADGARMIEMGESNWYGDVPTEQLERDIRSMISDSQRRDALLSELGALTRASFEEATYPLAKIFFRGIGGCASLASIDPGTPGSDYKFDLNNPVPLEQRFDLVANYGTAEHIFNIAQLYRTVHDLTEAGGLMIHHAPLNGWIDHGFYSIQPTLYFDLAIANEYQVVLAAVADVKSVQTIEITHPEHVIELVRDGKLPQNAVMEIVLRKPGIRKEFQIPMQGYYAGTLSAAASEAWRTLR